MSRVVPRLGGDDDPVEARQKFSRLDLPALGLPRMTRGRRTLKSGPGSKVESRAARVASIPGWLGNFPAQRGNLFIRVV